MKKELNIDKQKIIIILISAFLIVVFHNLKIDWYVKDIILPFSVILFSYIYMFSKEKELNKKAYYILIPIALILLSDLFIKIDYSNKILNIIILPIIISIFFMLLTNKNYSFNFEAISWILKFFPRRMFKNLKYLKQDKERDNNDNFKNIFVGAVIGTVIGFVILKLLMGADDYFGYFINNILKIFKFDFGNILLFVIAFILLFSIFINILLNKDTSMKIKELETHNNTIIVTVLSIINIIFVLFLISEISRLTINFLQLPEKYTYSSYAREGFFQLLFVTIINFSVIMYLLYKTSNVSKSTKIKNLLIVLIIFSIMLIINSYYRMFLYINNYGFTILRLQVILFLLMEFIIFLILTNKILKKLDNKDATLYFVIMISFYIVNLYLCNNTFVNLLQKLFIR